MSGLTLKHGRLNHSLKGFCSKPGENKQKLRCVASRPPPLVSLFRFTKGHSGSSLDVQMLVGVSNHQPHWAEAAWN